MHTNHATCVIIGHIMCYFIVIQPHEGGSIASFSYPTSSTMVIIIHYYCSKGGSVVEWLACWTQAQKGPGPGFKSQSRCCRVTVLGKLFTPIMPVFTKQQNW